MAPSNLAVLTKSHKIIASKKRAKKEQIKEVLFDDDARREFLTGFHKRKVLKKEAAKEKAIQRDKGERQEARREKRQMLAERAVQNAREVEKAYGAEMSEHGSEDEWGGVGESSCRRKRKSRADEREEEYEDEEQLATVTVVEDFDPEELLHGPKQHAVMDEDSMDHNLPEFRPSHTGSSISNPTQSKPKAEKKAPLRSSTKPKKVKYQTNAARKVERTKQQKRKLEKASRAGGKASRKRGGKR